MKKIFQFVTVFIVFKSHKHIDIYFFIFLFMFERRVIGNIWDENKIKCKKELKKMDCKKKMKNGINGKIKLEKWL
ncbi:hypothetical protein RFI_36488 [Reticulomyxa filosa]|uniref:Uncharacterized protein n=1 Tax=Reticulomyxa filosa TaxID=46433 RepID=X6LIJ1_RETFI|nr:hypothetical protein RFI_36488 [Reticulomyxa filosa]|eukprot:ETO00952.1 hypothetical protein RFI_36488 [Reticulomyxa filosa]